MTKMYINLYTHNHNSRKGIDDFCTTLTQIFSSRGLPVIEGDSLVSDGINLLIDEFSTDERVENLQNFKEKNKKASVVLVLTEFFQQHSLIDSLNLFDRILVPLFLCFYMPRLRWMRHNTRKFRIKECLKSLCVAPLVAPVLFMMEVLLYFLREKHNARLLNKILDIKSQFAVAIYMHNRFLGLVEVLGCVDGIIVAHDGIRPGLEEIIRKNNVKFDFIQLFVPELTGSFEKSLFLKNKLGLQVSGTITHYRKKCVDNLILDAAKSKIEAFKKVHIKSFSEADQQLTLSSAYSFHPPQSNSWLYSSPTRIYRSLQVDFSIPVLTRLFGDHPIEHVCLVYDGEETLKYMNEIFNDNGKLDRYVKEKVKPYISFSKRYNDSLVDIVKASSSEQNRLVKD